MLSFVNDYCEVAHERILRRMLAEQLNKQPGYGDDEICESAREKIREAIGRPEASVYFLVGGTQTNQIAIDTGLENYQGVVAATTGHVGVHEAGAIEFSRHKVLTVPSHEGKIDPAELDKFVEYFYKDGNHEHMVFPGMCYISHPSEYGTLYTRAELEELRRVCDKYEMKLFLDGARLGYGLAAEGTDVTLKDIAELTDLFYIGGTKVGAAFGEALVYPGGNEPAHFIAQIKQHGGLLAKGWILGIQFDELFTDGLYLQNGRNAIETAAVLKRALKEKGYEMPIASPTNQIFVKMSNSQIEELSKKVNFSFMDVLDDSHCLMRFCTSWATKTEDVEELIGLL